MESRKESVPILVLGGTGHYGRHIVGSLLDGVLMKIRDLGIPLVAVNRVNER